MKKYIALFLSLLVICLTVGAQEMASEAVSAEGSAEGSATEQEASAEATEATTTPVAATPEQHWEVANAAYNEGRYTTAVENYEAILADGLHSAKVYFNLGNAYFKQERLGKAILNYHRALRLAPADEDIRHNLEYATESTKDNIEQIPEFFLSTWVRKVRNLMGCNAWTICSLILLAASLAAALLYLLAERITLRKVGFYLMGVGAVLCIISTIFAYNEREALVGGKQAIIMSSAAPIKSSPDRAATDLFVLHEGTLLTIEERTEGWVEVRIADGRKGWIESSRIEQI